MNLARKSKLEITEEKLVCQEDWYHKEGFQSCYIHDEGRSLGVAFQEEMPNRPEQRR
jgi:hypothetical protein